MSNVTQEDISRAMEMVAMDKARELATQRQENEASGYVDGQEEFSTSRNFMVDSVKALVEQGLVSVNPRVKAAATELANNISNQYGSIEAFINKPENVNHLAMVGQQWAEIDRDVMGSYEAVVSIGGEMHKDNSTREAEADNARSWNNEPNRPEHEMVRSNVDGNNYYQTPNGLIPQDVYESHSVSPDALPFDGENQGEFAGLVDK